MCGLSCEPGTEEQGGHRSSPSLSEIISGGTVVSRLVTSLYMKNSIYRLVKLGLNSYSVCQPHQFPNISHTECTTYASGQSTSAHVIYSFGGVTMDDCNGAAILQE